MSDELPTELEAAQATLHSINAVIFDLPDIEHELCVATADIIRFAVGRAGPEAGRLALALIGVEMGIKSYEKPDNKSEI